jgi:hypothetical protein
MKHRIGRLNLRAQYRCELIARQAYKERQMAKPTPDLTTDLTITIETQRTKQQATLHYDTHYDILLLTLDGREMCISQPDALRLRNWLNTMMHDAGHSDWTIQTK